MYFYTFTLAHLARLILCCAATIGAIGTSHAQTYSKEQLQQTYVAHLSEQGYAPNITQNGNVSFRREGKIYLIQIDESDPEYFRLLIRFALSNAPTETRQKRLEGINAANSGTKVVKAYIDGEGLPNFACEMFLIVPGDFKTHLPRILRALDTAWGYYSRKLAETP